jgi:hypothetical protein
MIPLLLAALLSISTAHAAEPSLQVRAVPVALQTAARGAMRIPMMTLSLEASCEAPVTLHAITLYHEGLGQPRDLSAVYVQEGNRRLTRSSVPTQRDGKVLLRFRGITLAPCEKREWTILANLASDAHIASNHGLTLRSAQDIDIGGALVSAKTAPTAVTSAGAIAEGEITVSYMHLVRRIEWGSNRIVARLKLEADGENRHVIDAITFTNDGKARNADLQNLWIGNTRKERLSAILDQMDGDKARFIFEDPLELDRNGSMTLEVHADIRASRSQTVRFEIEEASDIEAHAQKVRPRT